MGQFYDWECSKKSSRKTAIWVGHHMMRWNGSNCIPEGENFVSEGSKVETCTPQTLQCGYSIKSREWEVMKDKGYTGNMKLKYNSNCFYPLPMQWTWIINLSLCFPISTTWIIDFLSTVDLNIMLVSGIQNS